MSRFVTGNRPPHTVDLHGMPNFHELARIKRLVHDQRHFLIPDPDCPFCPLRKDVAALRFRAEAPIAVAP